MFRLRRSLGWLHVKHLKSLYFLFLNLHEDHDEVFSTSIRCRWRFTECVLVAESGRRQERVKTFLVGLVGGGMEEGRRGGEQSPLFFLLIAIFPHLFLQAGRCRVTSCRASAPRRKIWLLFDFSWRRMESCTTSLWVLLFLSFPAHSAGVWMHHLNC